MTATVRSPGPQVGRPARLGPLAAPIACGCCLAAGAAYIVAQDPSEGGVFLTCPFRALTGWWCPGCGVTRATHHLFRGDIHQALRYNLFIVLILLGLGVAWLAWTLRAAGRSVAVRVPVWVQVASVSVLLAFAVVRNLPGVPGLRG